MRLNCLFIALLFALALCAAPWAQPLKSLTFTRKILYHDFGMNDSIKVHNPNLSAVKLDSVEVWSESRAEGSLVGLTFQPMATPVQIDGTIQVYVPEKRKAITQGIFVWASILTLGNRNLAVQPKGDALISRFMVDRCPACKQSASAAIIDTLRFKFIFHHSIAADTILVITDNRIGVSLQPVARNASKLRSVAGIGFDFLGRRARALGFQSMPHGMF